MSTEIVDDLAENRARQPAKVWLLSGYGCLACKAFPSAFAGRERSEQAKGAKNHGAGAPAP